MAEIDCPFCEAPCLVEPAEFRAPSFTLRCADCGVAVEVAAAAAEAPLARAA